MRLPAYFEYSLRASHLQVAVCKAVLVQVTDSNSSSKLHSGSGSEAIIGASSMGVIACKKSRVSLRVRRTTLRHGARIMQLFQGHPAIPKLVGYHREAHFEYIGMELLGKELKVTVERLEPGSGRLHHALKMGTVVRIGAQMVCTVLPQWHIS
jgi:predicted Ser/Thr protein kinase